MKAFGRRATARAINSAARVLSLLMAEDAQEMQGLGVVALVRSTRSYNLEARPSCPD